MYTEIARPKCAACARGTDVERHERAACDTLHKIRMRKEELRGFVHGLVSYRDIRHDDLAANLERDVSKNGGDSRCRAWDHGVELGVVQVIT